jgi:hypothetical protein
MWLGLLCLAYLTLQLVVGFVVMRRKLGLPSHIDLEPLAASPAADDVARWIAGYATLGFTPVGRFRVSGLDQPTTVHALLAADKNAFAVIYEVAAGPERPDRRAERQVVSELVSEWDVVEAASSFRAAPKGEETRRALTTTTTAITVHVDDPLRMIRRLPAARDASTLVAAHREGVRQVAAPFTCRAFRAEDFPARFERGWYESPSRRQPASTSCGPSASLAPRAWRCAASSTSGSL